MLGTAWPSMRAGLHLPLGDLGLILIMVTIGSVLVSSIVGRALRRFGLPALLTISGAAAAMGAIGFAGANGLPMLLGLSLCFGVSAGITDGTLNTALALAGRQRLLNLLHGFYGIGASTGPLLITATVLLGSWRDGYIALACYDIVVAIAWLRLPTAYATLKTGRPQDATKPVSDGTSDYTRGIQRTRSLRSAILWSLATFFIYVGLEVAAGQWETSYLRLYLHLSPLFAGVATFSYWGALTVTRISLASFRRALNNRSIVHLGAALGLVCTAMIWWNPNIAVTILSFITLGAALAGIFPALVALTPERVDPRRAPHLIAWEIGAASAGGALLSGGVGLILSKAGLGSFGFSLVLLAICLNLSAHIVERTSTHRTPSPQRLRRRS